MGLGPGNPRTMSTALLAPQTGGGLLVGPVLFDRGMARVGVAAESSRVRKGGFCDRYRLERRCSICSQQLGVGEGSNK